MQSIICVCSEQAQIIDCIQTLVKRGTNCLAHDKIRQDVNRPLPQTYVFRDSQAILIRVEKIAICTPSRIIAQQEGKWAAEREVMGSISRGGSIFNVFQRLTHDQTFTWHRWRSPTLLLQWKTKKTKKILFNQRTFRLNTFEKQCVFFLPKCMEAVALDEIFASW